MSDDEANLGKPGDSLRFVPFDYSISGQIVINDSIRSVGLDGTDISLALLGTAKSLHFLFVKVNHPELIVCLRTMGRQGPPPVLREVVLEWVSGVASSMIEALLAIPTLRILRIRGASLDDHAFASIAQFLRSNTTLLEINLLQLITPPRCRHWTTNIIRALATNKGLRTFGCTIMGDCDMSTVASALQTNTTLRSVELYNYRLPHSHWLEIVETFGLLHNKTVEDFRITAVRGMTRLRLRTPLDPYPYLRRNVALNKAKAIAERYMMQSTQHALSILPLVLREVTAESAEPEWASAVVLYKLFRERVNSKELWDSLRKSIN